MTAGMAAASPTAVAMRASLMPGATTARPADPRAPISRKEVMMPPTVPKSPTKGVGLAPGGPAAAPARRAVGGLEPLRLPEQVEEIVRALLRAPQLEELPDDDRPR